MTSNPLALNLLAACCYVVGGVFMKLSVGLTRLGPGVMLFVCFLAGAGLQAVAMRRAELSAAYVLVLGLEAALSFALGTLFFRESVSPWKLLGVVLIVGGVLLLRGHGD